MDVRELLETSRLYDALHKSDLYNKRVPSVEYQSGRFKKLPRFTKLQNFLLESLYTINDLHNPTAFRIYLYLLRQITGYVKRTKIEYRPKKMKCDMNMGNNFYKGIDILKVKKMIRIIEVEGIDYICLNPDPNTWETDSRDRIGALMDKEINAILGISDITAISKCSSSWSSSSSSSASYQSNDGDLLMELNKL